ncbi:TadE/TadG family type IV pilus assembly protein [Pseudomonas sp. GL-R-26]|uniref:TadE/TadG family type IV pilus assembly protein n=1 Tax=Pseudomonas sp. GL-R-26 TaxID=2832392 RepID=UPI001CC03D8E|nr:TadE family protein [Pseudomonas sp. GL-R-26]
MNRKYMRGTYVVEFAIIGLLMFTLLFGVVEMGRLYFTVNALDEVVRRGTRLAVVCGIDDDLMIRKRAIFNDEHDPDTSLLIGDLNIDHLKLTYLDADGAEVANPATSDYAIRYVQLSLTGFVFNLFIPGFGVSITLPAFKATLPRESLGRESTQC